MPVRQLAAKRLNSPSPVVTNEQRQDQVRCDGSNPRCRDRARTSEPPNSAVAWEWQGSWRERRGLHVFVSFATSPERAGVFESKFWHRSVMQACFHSSAVYHAAAAIGALQEQVFHRSRNEGPPADDEGVAFALRQCNKSIALLTDPSQKTQSFSTGVALVTCVLFACFEALLGDPTLVVSYSLQGRTLLRGHEEMVAARTPISPLVDPEDVRPILGSLEIKAKSLQGARMKTSDTRSDPPLPKIDTIHSLAHANWTLHAVQVRMLAFCQDLPADTQSAAMAQKMEEKQATFAPWLREWKQSFATFLFRSSASLSAIDIQRAKVLKANHIHTSVYAALDLRCDGAAAWAPFHEEFKTIVELAASVLDAFGQNPSTKINVFQSPFLWFGLWVAEPLYVAMARCSNSDTRRRAAALLSNQARAMRVRGDYTPATLCSTIYTTVAKPTNTEGWTDEQWIDYAQHTRVDRGMLTFFGRLPSDFIQD